MKPLDEAQGPKPAPRMTESLAAGAPAPPNFPRHGFSSLNHHGRRIRDSACGTGLVGVGISIFAGGGFIEIWFGDQEITRSWSPFG